MMNTHKISALAVIGLFALLAGAPQAHAQLAGPCTTITGAPCASGQDIATATNELKEALLDGINKNAKAQSDESNANKEFDDAQKQKEKAQDQVVKSADKQDQLTFNAIMKYQPTAADCVAATNGYMLSYDLTNKRKQMAELRQLGADLAKNGAPGGSTASSTQIAQKIQEVSQKLAKNQTLTASDAKYVRDLNALAKACTTPDCYNDALKQQIKDLQTQTIGDKAPVNAKMNPQMAQYFLERSKWEGDRSAALQTVLKTLPKMMTSMDYFNKALADYIKAYGATADKAKEMLNNEYPNSSAIGLSYYQFQEASFNALIAGDATAVRVSETVEQQQRNAQILQANAAMLQVASMERAQFEVALKQLGLPAPAVSASALSIQ